MWSRIDDTFMVEFFFVLMLVELEETLNKEFLMVRCGDLELWVENAQ